MSDIKEDKTRDCGGTGKGFGRTDNSDIATECCPLPDGQGKGYAKCDTETMQPQESGDNSPICKGAGKGYARTADCDIAAEDCPLPDGPGKGFAKKS